MRKNSRWLFGQSNNQDLYWGEAGFSYLFLISKAKKTGDIVWDMRGGEWALDGVGHMSFRLELIS
jgi:hypothetical protein